MGDARDGGVEDLRPAAEVAPEHDPGVAGEPLAEREHIARLRSSPAVDQLIVVGDRAKIEQGIKDLGIGKIHFIDADGKPI